MSGPNNPIEQNTKGWLNYRPEIKVLDCTVRDGGLMNDHHFKDDFIRAVYDSCVAAGVDYMELGYKANKKLFSTEKFGPWKFSDEDYIKKIIPEKSPSIKFSVMADVERTDYHNDIFKVEDSVFDMIRVATYIHQIPAAIEMVKDAHDKGYETTINIMAISIVSERELDEALEAIAKSPVDVIYLVDSFGSLYGEQIQYYSKKYLKFASTGKQVGLHAHNNQQLAYANTITAVVEGVNLLDATIDGMGRGAGNCPMELLLGFLHNPKFHVRPIIECLQKTVRPLRDSLKWGYEIPYMLTGQFNRHPRSAMKHMDGEEIMDFIKFYDNLLEEE